MIRAEFKVSHCFYFGGKRELRRHGIKVRKVWGRECTYMLEVPVNMLQPKKGAFGGIDYHIIKPDGYYLGHIYGKKLTWVPGFNIDAFL